MCFILNLSLYSHQTATILGELSSFIQNDHIKCPLEGLTDLKLLLGGPSLTSQPFKPLLLTLLADDKQQRDAESHQDDGRADGKQLFHVVAFSSS